MNHFMALLKVLDFVGFCSIDLGKIQPMLSYSHNWYPQEQVLFWFDIWKMDMCKLLKCWGNKCVMMKIILFTFFQQKLSLAANTFCFLEIHLSCCKSDSWISLEFCSNFILPCCRVMKIYKLLAFLRSNFASS